KADMVLESFAEGILDQIRLKEGESAPVGAVIATMRGAGDSTRPPAAAESANGPSAETKAKPVEKKSAPIPIRPKTRKDIPAPPTPAAVERDTGARAHPALAPRAPPPPPPPSRPPPPPPPLLCPIGLNHPPMGTSFAPRRSHGAPPRKPESILPPCTAPARRVG